MKKLTSREFDLVKIGFLAIAEPDNLELQIEAEEQRESRYRFALRRFAAPWVWMTTVFNRKEDGAARKVHRSGRASLIRYQIFVFQKLVPAAKKRGKTHLAEEGRSDSSDGRVSPQNNFNNTARERLRSISKSGDLSPMIKRSYDNLRAAAKASDLFNALVLAFFCRHCCAFFFQCHRLFVASNGHPPADPHRQIGNREK